jgi:hypothetical protein
LYEVEFTTQVTQTSEKSSNKTRGPQVVRLIAGRTRFCMQSKIAVVPGSRGGGLSRVPWGLLCLELALLHALLPLAHSASPVDCRRQQPTEIGMGRRRELAPALLQTFRQGKAPQGLAFIVTTDAGTGAREAGCGAGTSPVALVHAFVARGLRTLANVAAQDREDVVQPSQLSSLGQQPLLAKVPQRRCTMCGSLTSRLTTDPVDAPQCCESCGCSGA